ncbi:josephin-like protein [Papaver somniferum]|uniref:josephin-like protein n=1 Tax=Papaver somniferum TaxID=3469 RepID=UPI000E6FC647|nr:josephin-like protein [Papaver somniferum]
MSSNGSSSRRVNFSPDINDTQNISLKSNYRVTGNRRRAAGISGFRVPKSSLSSSSSSQAGFSPMNFLCRLSNKVVRALRMVSLRRRRTSPKVSSSYPSSSSSSSSSNQYNNLARSRSYVNHHHVDSHQSEAIEDCIQFINSSSSFQRSNSVSAC